MDRTRSNHDAAGHLARLDARTDTKRRARGELIPVLVTVAVALSFVVSVALEAVPTAGGTNAGGAVVAGKRVSAVKRSTARPSKSRARAATAARSGGGAAKASTPSGAKAMTGTPGVFAAPAWIDATCAKDASGPLLEWIASVPDGSTLSFVPGGCYRITGSLTIWNRSNLTFEGNGATFRSYSKGPLNRFGYSDRRHFWFRLSDGMTLRNMKVVGTNTVSDTGRAGFGSYASKYEFEHAFAFQGCKDLTLENLSVDAVWGDGIYLGGSRKYPSKRVVVRNVTIDHNGRQGVAITGAEDVLIDNVDLLHSRRAGFDLEPNPSGYVRGVEIRNSYTNTHLLAFPSGGYGEVNNIYIHHNTIDGLSAPWVLVRASDGYRRANWKIWDNTVVRRLGSTKAAMSFFKVDGVDIRRNVSRVSLKRARLAVSFVNAGGTLRVLDNDFDGACAPYVKDAATGAVTASGNIVSSC